MSMPSTRPRGYEWLILLAWLVYAPLVSAAPADWQQSGDSASMIVVAMAEKADAAIGAGATPRGYDGLPTYRGSQRSITAAQRLARDYALVEVVAWTIEPLRLRCMVYRIDDKNPRDVLLQRLQKDRRVLIAQPLQEFQTLEQPAPALTSEFAATGSQSPYNDPYLHLQTSFASLHATTAQRWSTGSGSRIALIDTAVDANHPDLAGRIVEQRDLVADGSSREPLSAAEQRHGTEVAGLIAAVANNRIGIVGIAPAVQILSYRACWGQTGAARCNTFTLALALTAAIQSKARIINLSLGGPADPLLQQLLVNAIEQGAIIIGAVPPDGSTDGFPIGVKGVIAVTSSDDPSRSDRVLRAPGRDVLTLQAGGHYGYASGSSLATAQVSAVIALLLQRRPNLDAALARELLLRSQGAKGPIDACTALAILLDRADGACVDSHVLASRNPEVTTR